MNVITLALRDIRYNFRTYIPVFFSVFFSVGIISAIICYSGIIDRQISSKLKTDEPCVMIITNNNININRLGAVKEILKDDPLIEEMGLYYSDSAVYFVPPVFYEVNPGAVIDSSYESAEAVIDGIKYKFDNSRKYAAADFITITAADMENQLLDEDDMLCGNMLTEEKQILLPQQYLAMFGIKAEEYENLIGKSFSLYVSSEKRKISVINEFKIAGVIDKDYFGENGFISPFIPYITPKYKECFGNIVLNAVVAEYDIEKVRSLKTKLENSEAVNVSFNREYEEIDFYYSQKEFVYKIISLIALFFTSAIALHLIVYMFFSSQQTVKMSKMLIAMGLTENEVCIFRSLENTITAAIAAVSGTVIFSIIACKAFAYINYYAVSDAVIIDYGVLTLVCLIVILIIGFSGFFINRRVIKAAEIR